MTGPDRRIAALARGQLGAFRRRQAHEMGLSDHQLRSRVSSGILIQVGPNAFRFAGAPVSRLTELNEVLLDIGPPVWAAWSTAGALHHYDGYELVAPFHVLVPRGRSIERDDVEIHTSISIGPVDRCVVHGIPATSPARTIIDLARTATSAELAATIDSALRDRRLTEDSLHRNIIRMRSQGRYGLPLLAEVLAGNEVSRGGHSWLEREYLRLLHRAGLPLPEMQQVLARDGNRLVRVDCRFPGTNVIVELLGYRFHRSRRDMQRDASRANALLAKGLQPFQFTYAHVVSEADYVVKTTALAIARAATATPAS